ncbi:MAG: hypothetical protein QOI21_6207 [Actinomycetota bacterium]|nr:hypothetical protein [Actinomycetota bacterium]
MIVPDTQSWPAPRGRAHAGHHRADRRIESGKATGDAFVTADRLPDLTPSFTPPHRLAVVRPFAPRTAAPDRVAITRLTIRDSPRLNGEDDEHIRRLAEAETPLPPILVHHDTMLVVDGVHRVRAAQLRGEDTIEVEFLHCELSQTFVIAVRSNLSHGLPLSLADRKAAAARILASHPELSDRAIGDITRSDHKTIGRIRREVPEPAAGRAARSQGTRRREIAEEIMTRQPKLSLRQVAKAAGISVSTAHDVRKRMTADDVRPPAAGQRRRAPDTGQHLATNATAVMRKLTTDPSLRLTDDGRTLLRLLGSQHLTEDEWHRLAGSVPSHWTTTVADLAREYAMTWLDFATRLNDTADDRDTR